MTISVVQQLIVKRKTDFIIQLFIVSSKMTAIPQSIVITSHTVRFWMANAECMCNSDDLNKKNMCESRHIVSALAYTVFQDPSWERLITRGDACFYMSYIPYTAVCVAAFYYPSFNDAIYGVERCGYSNPSRYLTSTQYWINNIWAIDSESESAVLEGVEKLFGQFEDDIFTLCDISRVPFFKKHGYNEIEIPVYMGEKNHNEIVGKCWLSKGLNH